MERSVGHWIPNYLTSDTITIVLTNSFVHFDTYDTYYVPVFHYQTLILKTRVAQCCGDDQKKVVDLNRFIRFQCSNSKSNGNCEARTHDLRIFRFVTESHKRMRPALFQLSQAPFIL